MPIIRDMTRGYVPERQDGRLPVRVLLQRPNGDWLQLNSGPYQIAGDSFSNRQMQWRRHEVSSPYVDGTFVVNAAAENVVEQLAFYVRGKTHTEMQQAIEVATEALSQLSFTMMVEIGENGVYWDCSIADYTVQTTREFLHATMAKVTATVPRSPQARAVEQLEPSYHDELFETPEEQ